MSSASQNAEPVGGGGRRLPPGWLWCAVDDVGDVAIGRQLPRNGQRTTIDLPYLRVANVHDDAIDFADVSRMALPADEWERYALRAGDILLCEGQSLELVGRAAVYRGELDRVLFQNTLIRFRADDAIDTEFALMVFRTFQRDGTFASTARSTTNLAHLGLSRFRKVRFPLAPPDVQSRLGASGRAAQNQLDYIREWIVATTQHAETLLGLLRSSAIVNDGSWVSAGGPLPELPQGWRWAAANDVVAEGAPIVYGILQPGPDVGADGIPYIRGAELRDGFILTESLRHTTPAIAERYARSALEAGDVLVGLVRHPRVAIVPAELEGAHITQGAARLRPGADIDPGFLAHWLASPVAQAWFKARMRGIDMPGLNLRDVRQIPVPVPPHEVQAEIVERLDQAVASATYILSALARIQRGATRLESQTLADHVFGSLADSVTKSWTLEGGGPSADELLSDIQSRRALRRKSKARRSVVRARPDAHDSQAPLGLETLGTMLRGTANGMTPEELFQRSGGDESAIEEWYLLLRAAQRAGNVIQRRISDAEVRLFWAE